MDYEKKYKEALKRAKGIHSFSSDIAEIKRMEQIFPELKESKEEWIEKLRKEIITFLGNKKISSINESDAINVWIAWLEKQCGCNIDCPQNHQDSSRPNGCIVLEDFNSGEGFYKLNLDYLNKKQVEEVEEMVRTWNKESKTLEAINEQNVDNSNKVEQKFKVGDFVKDTNHHKQPIYKIVYIDKECYICESDDVTLGDKAVMHFAFDNPYLRLVEQYKFHVDDWICNSACTVHIASIKDGMYYFDEGDGLDITFVDNNYHLWSIADAKDGDVLVHNGCTFIFMGIKDDIVQAIEENMLELVPFGEPEYDKDYHPATKEQRDTLIKAMTEAGYTFDFEKKELKKIETPLPSFDEAQGTPIIEIPFGAKDSELQEATYHIPEDFHAEIQGNKVIIKKGKNSSWSKEDEYNLTDTCVAIRKLSAMNKMVSESERMIRRADIDQFGPLSKYIRPYLI